MKERGINIMREILFRGKLTDDGKWVEGYYCPCIFGRFPSSPAIISKEDMDNGYWHPEKIIPSTVGQYTGLTDKNGTKIFEGDVLEFSDRLVEVFWHAFLGQWDCRFIKFTNKENGIDNMSTVNWSWKAKVIGNIHDNPELMR